ncbi:SH3 domain-containing protein [Clostridium cibarium]|uniref:SH3 domain-containing protein n=1 Tax=Clostridium cibarium TaxID=2762247 RepID=A0ABR8PXS7_9CLOT|nr:SH3 domain-containing protein [Clostridium cibarium]MBD7912961.1 SH3 domain-containing protein [Clostridium cibarium]
MKRNKIMKLVVASSAIAGGISLSSNTVHATENNAGNIKTGELTKSSMALKSVTKGKVVNISTNLRVRSDAGTNYDTIGYLYNGQEIEVNSEKGGWYRISFNGREGYVSKDYINLNESLSNTVVTSEKKGQVINITSSLNIRQSASTGSAVIGSLRNGDTFEIISNSNGWYNIKSQNTIGFINGEYVKEVDSSSIQNKPEPQVEVKSGVKGKVVNITSNLRVRTSPSTSSSILGYILNGQEVGITGENGDWYKISFNNSDGYVSKEYVQKENATPVNTKAETQENFTASGRGQVTNVTNSLNIRQSASTSSRVLGSLRNGENFDIIGKSGNWYNIRTGSVTGYVSGDYVKEVSGNSVPSSTPQQAASGRGQVTNITNSLNIRQSASTSSKVIGSLRNGEGFDIIGKSGNWYNIRTGSVTGYVSGDYVRETSGSSDSTNHSEEVISNQKGQVINITSNLRVRSSAGTNSTVLGYLLNNQIVNITGKRGQWIKINFNGQAGYVSSEYIKVVNSSTSDEHTNNTSTFYSIFNAMKSQLGSPYVWGGDGESLTTTLLNSLRSLYPIKAAGGFYNRAASYVNQGYRAFDCSGLMQWGYKQAGISIGRTTWDQIGDGTEVSLSDLKPGDLLFYSSLEHVGMYIGNGQWIEAPNSSSNVRIVNVPWSKIGRARRILG